MSAIDIALASPDPTCTLHWIGRALGHRGSDDTLADYVGELIRENGFPAPLPHRKHGGGISRDICARRSRWIRVGVVAWFSDFLPPAASAAIEERQRLADADDMDRRAATLHLCGGTEA